MNLKNEELWNEWETKNVDPYGKQCVDVARRVMEIMDENPNLNIDASALVHQANKDLPEGGGITGFMAGAVAQMVTGCHSRGEEFNASWNKEYGVDNTDGVVNPAIMTIDTGDE